MQTFLRAINFYFLHIIRNIIIIGASINKNKVKMFKNYAKCEERIKQVESILNVAGYFPKSSVLSGYTRAWMGTAQVIAGVALAILSSLASSYFKDQSGEYAQDSKRFRGYMWNGLLNLVRGTLEIGVGIYDNKTPYGVCFHMLFAAYDFRDVIDLTGRVRRTT